MPLGSTKSSATTLISPRARIDPVDVVLFLLLLLALDALARKLFRRCRRRAGSVNQIEPSDADNYVPFGEFSFLPL